MISENGITIKTPEEIAGMRESGRLLAKVLAILKQHICPRVSTYELDQIAESEIIKGGGRPLFKNYDGFPNALCTSINEVIVHGIPSKKAILKEGDIISLDLGVKLNGFLSDSAITVGVGNIDLETKRLLMVTRKALKLGIKKALIGNTTEDIGNTIQRYVESENFNVVRELVGHGIGKDAHEDPEVPNYGKRHQGYVLREGMTICIEPMVVTGSYEIKKAPDHYGWQTRDGNLSCHFEHTLAITTKGSVILTDL